MNNNMPPQLSIIIPAYNEEHNIKKTLLDHINYFTNKFNFEIIVVMDGCKDNTFSIVSELSYKHPQIRYLTYPKKLGKGGGIIKGFKSAMGEKIAFTDADGSTPPDQLYKLVQQLDHYDAVIGSRWMKESIIQKKESLPRRMASRSFNFMVRILFNLPLKDTQCGAKAFHKYIIDDINGNLKLTNFAFDVELLFIIQKNGYTISEIPINWNHDDFTELKVAKAIPSMFLSIIGLRMKHSPYWFLVPQWLIKPIHNKLKAI